MPEVNHSEKRINLMSMQQWMDYELSDSEKDVVIGSPDNAIVAARTKNLIEAPEKSFKTTFTHRLMAGLSCGQTVFPGLPVISPHKVLYLHGEMTNRDIKDRVIKGCVDLNGPFDNLIEGRVFDGHLVSEAGQQVIRDLVKTYNPDDLVLDPWQSFITGEEENSNTVFSSACKFCDELILDCGVTLWLPIHLGKNPAKGPRGHSYILGWRDNAFRLTRTGETLKVEVDARWAEPVKPFFLKFQAGTLVSCGEADVPAGKTCQPDRIMEFLASEGGRCTKDQLGEYLRTNREATRKAIKRAAEKYSIKTTRTEVYLEQPTGVPESFNIQ